MLIVFTSVSYLRKTLCQAKDIDDFREPLKTHNSRLVTNAKAEFTIVNKHFAEGA